MDKNTGNYPLDKVLMCAACEIAVHGYVSHNQGVSTGADSTKFWVQQMLKGSDFGKAHQQNLLEAAKDKELDLFGATFKVAVFDVIQWARKIDPYSSEYNAVIHTIANRKPATVTSREFGQVASMLMTYQRHLAKRKQVYAGAVGNTITLDVEITNIKMGHGVHGEWWWVRAKTTKSEILINWFTNKEPAFRPDDKLTINGYVKEHSEFNDDKWTKLNRVKVLSGFGSKVS